MVVHVTYHEQHYSTARACLASIRDLIELGWQVSQIRGPEGGPYVVIYRREEAHE